MTEPTELSKLRHLYQNMVNGAVRDTASAKRIAEGLLAPAIEALERATPPAEQAAPKAAPGEPCRTCNGTHYTTLTAWSGRELCSDCGGSTQAAPQQEAQEPLTDEQLAEMMRETWGCASIAPRHATGFARAIERAHGIGIGIKGGQHGTDTQSN